MRPTVISGKQIVDLNLNGRNYQALITLVPGAAQDNAFNPTASGGLSLASVYFNGTRMGSNTFYIDSGESADDSGGGEAFEAQ